MEIIISPECCPRAQQVRAHLCAEKELTKWMKVLASYIAIARVSGQRRGRGVQRGVWCAIEVELIVAQQSVGRKVARVH